MINQEIKKETGVISPGVEKDYTAAEKKELTELYTSFTSSSIQPRRVVEARIVRIGKKYVVLDLGEKSDGFLPKTDFKNLEEIKIGDKTEVYVEHLEDVRGHLVISRKKALHLKAWETLEGGKKNSTTLEGLVKRKIKGGLVLDILGIEVFLPGGQVDIVRTSPEDLEGYIGRVVEALVIKISKKKQNAVVSRRMLIQKEHEKHNKELLSSLQAGQVVPATVTSIANFGLFLKIDGKIVGLLHKNDIAFDKRLPNVAEAVDDKGDPVFEVGQHMEVVIKDIDLEKSHISLSTKLISWSKLPEDIVKGSKIKGVVTEIAESFALLRLLDGVIAFLHVSEMSHGDRNKNPHDFVKLGQMLEVAVLDIDREKHELQVSLKKLTDDLWESDLIDKYAVGTIHSGVVSSLLKHGAMLMLEGGIQGYLDKTHFSWLEKVQDPASFLKKGEVKDVMILEVDRSQRLMLVGLRETTESPWPALRDTFVPGTVHECTILSFVTGGAIIQLPKSVQTFIPTKELELGNEGNKLKEGDTLSLKVMRFVEGEQKIMLSSNIHETPSLDSSARKHHVYQENQTTLGDLEVLKQLRKELSEKDKEEEPARKTTKKKKTTPRTD